MEGIGVREYFAGRLGLASLGLGLALSNLTGKVAETASLQAVGARENFLPAVEVGFSWPRTLNPKPLRNTNRWDFLGGSWGSDAAIRLQDLCSGPITLRLLRGLLGL